MYDKNIPQRFRPARMLCFLYRDNFLNPIRQKAEHKVQIGLRNASFALGLFPVCVHV
jgi:hypothetical protein